MPAYSTRNGTAFGWVLLLIGPLGFLGMHFSWFANPLAFVAWLKMRKGKKQAAVVSSCLALGLALTFLFQRIIPEGDAGWFEYTVGPGYFVWLIGLGALLVATIFSGPVSEARASRVDA
jgi:hypothetical protein